MAQGEPSFQLHVHVHVHVCTYKLKYTHLYTCIGVIHAHVVQPRVCLSCTLIEYILLQQEVTGIAEFEKSSTLIYQFYVPQAACKVTTL